MARITLLASQMLNMDYSEDYGMVMCVLSESFALTNGEMHTVVWDGEEYSCEPFAITNVSNGVGNPVVVGDVDNGMPFAVISLGGTEVLVGAIYDQASTTHTLAIYRGEADSNAGDVIVKDRDGNDVTHEGASRIRTRTTDGNTKEFVDADNIPNPVTTAVELDFSDGDMEVLPGDNEVFSGVTIEKPDALIPENIAEGVNIFGIIGALVAGGSNLKIAVGNSNYKSHKGGEITIQHGLGCVPDIVFIGIGANPAGSINNAAGTSKALYEKYGVRFNFYAAKTSAGAWTSAYTTEIDRVQSNAAIHKATETEFSIGNDTYSLSSSFNYPWIAIGGLT